jgi:hypothetical protein
MFHGSTFVLPEILFSYREVGKTSAKYMEDITGVTGVPAGFAPFTDLVRNLLHVIDESLIGSDAKAAMRKDLLRNVCQKNELWSRLMAQEHPAIAHMPSYRHGAELRALLTPEVGAEPWLRRKAVYWRYLVDTRFSRMMPKGVLDAVKRNLSFVRRSS